MAASKVVLGEIPHFIMVSATLEFNIDLSISMSTSLIASGIKLAQPISRAILCIGLVSTGPQSQKPQGLIQCHLSNQAHLG